MKRCFRGKCRPAGTIITSVQTGLCMRAKNPFNHYDGLEMIGCKGWDLYSNHFVSIINTNNTDARQLIWFVNFTRAALEHVHLWICSAFWREKTVLKSFPLRIIHPTQQRRMINVCTQNMDGPSLGRIDAMARNLGNPGILTRCVEGSTWLYIGTLDSVSWKMALMLRYDQVMIVTRRMHQWDGDFPEMIN